MNYLKSKLDLLFSPSSLLISIIAGLSVIIIILVLACSNSTQFSNNVGSKIIFISERDGNRDIFSMNIDGTEQTNLTRSIAKEYEFDISPDGSKIIYRRIVNGRPSKNLYLMDIDGDNLRLIPIPGNYPTSPVFSPENNNVFYIADIGSDAPGYYIIDLEGNVLCYLAHKFKGAFSNFSSNGSKVLLYLFNPIDEVYNLASMNSDGTGVTQIPNSVGYGWAIFSYSAESIYLSLDRDGDFDIYKINLDGTDLTKLTDFDKGSQFLIDSNMDRSILLFVSNLWIGGMYEFYDLLTMKNTGEEVTKVFSFSVDNLSYKSIAMSRDGKMLVFQYTPENEEYDLSSLEIYIVNSDGSGLKRLTDNSSLDAEAKFVP